MKLHLNLFLSLFVFISCKKFVEVPAPIDQVIGDAAFNDDATATSAITGLYARMMGNNGGGQFATAGTSIYLALSADELNFLSTSQSLVQQYQEFYTNSISSSSSNFWTRFWQNPFSYIYHINACIEGLEKTKEVTEPVKKQLLGEMKFMRGFIYFYLVNEFGAIPLITGTDYYVNAKLPRHSEPDIYISILRDLNEADDLLLASYPSSGRARPNKWVVKAMLARVYLYNSKWELASSYATSVINSGQYNLPSLTNTFLLTSTEAILQMPTSASAVVNSYDGNILIPSTATAIPSFPISNTLFNAFETGDLRKTSWLKSNIVSGQVYYYPFKYKIRTNTTPPTEATVILRLAEQYLIRAEANAQLGNIQASQNDLNQVRNRAGLGNTSASTKDNLLLAISKERQIELFTEWGHRWLDLKRTGKINEVMPGVKGANWQTTDALYPIPETELRYNPFLVQNPGY